MAAPGSTVEAGEAPWARPADEVLAQLGVTRDGLSGDEARRRLDEVGPNRLAPPARTPWWRRVLDQFRDVLIYVLLASAALKALLRDWVDVTVIVAVTVINAAVGLIQEGRAEQALNAISKMLSVRAAVRRDGAWRHAEAEGLVPGDVVRVAAGDRVPADIRLSEAVNLQVEESALTGESVAAGKSPEPVAADAGIGDRSSMLFSGTLVVAGTGRGVVVGTGADTEIGRIQAMIAEVEPLETPLSRTLGRFGKQLAVLIVVMAAVMILVGALVYGDGAEHLISAAIGFAVAAVPEGMPALVTITMALGVQQMARRRAITRRLPSVETLGSVTTICSDKTGTLTKNEMTATRVLTADVELEVTGVGYAPEGEVRLDDAPVSVEDRADLRVLAEVMTLCNDARLVREDDGWRLVGEPTDGSLRALGPKAGFTPDGWTRHAELPFDSATKYMAVLVESPHGERHVLLKGAPDRVLARCTSQAGADGGAEPLDTGLWERRIEELSAQGLRVLAAARTVPRAAAPAGLTAADVAGDLELVGLVGIVDPPRPEAVAAIAECKRGGIAVKMITGDHAGTATAIAREMGLAGDGTRVLTGAELEEMSDEALRERVREVDVYARTSPEHKVRIVRALQYHGEVVAMTGDGVNDAPALAQADVGVAMGIKGTEATKEAADVVLGDDNFATIVAAVEEGRRIYDNVRKSVLFLLPTNGAQSLVILIAVLAGLTLPLEPVQVLWINMVTAVTLSLSLANEPAERGSMDRPPRDPRAPLLSRAFLARVLVVSLLIGGVAMALFYYELERGAPIEEARTTAVSMLALAQLAYLLNCRFLQTSSVSRDVLHGNRAIWWSALALLVLQAVFVYAPFMHTWFGSAAIGMREWGLVLVLAVVVFALTELSKTLPRRRSGPEPDAQRTTS
ncbi:HAD-IC family P-type ATPase [Nocardioides sp. zg-536]|uniref:HAD-IC family P-type ATPase n=1 Tax=Nocardioides faecalis TaxID=2803858 RepID=A0A938YB28_9ACTN|nr:HAD-IC family P-type ATPase [Nocardioides faecalis]MBM9460579.1 HAD-IC family P-type ATPase [Nocardioides faecalis]QVI57495.1 HAD-IC family P-type ATPase [Nocardioides faecalis]